MTVKISKPAINLREELASLRNQGGLPKEDKLYVETLENGDFSAGTVGWTEYNYLASVSASNGQLTVTSTGTANGSFAYQKINTKVGKTYKLAVNISSTTVAYVRANNTTIHPWDYLGGTSFNGTANVTKEFTFVATQDHTYIGLGTNNTSVGNSATYNSITVQEVGENLVTNGTFDNSTTGWTATDSNLSVVNGKLRITNSTAGTYGDAFQLVPVVAGKTYTVNIETTDGTGDLYWMVHRVGVSSGYFNGSNTSSYTFTPTSSGNVEIIARLTELGSSNVPVDSGDYADIDNVRITEGNHQVIQSVPYGYDVKDVYIDGELAREGEAYDYEVKTDGINQWLKPTVEPTATTETVVIGVRK